MIDLEPGEIYTFSVTVSNPVNSAEDFNYKAYAAPYSVANMEYDADVVTKTDHTRMADWINILEPTGVIAPNETKEIEFTITVPENAPGGGQYAAIVVGQIRKAIYIVMWQWQMCWRLLAYFMQRWTGKLYIKVRC